MATRTILRTGSARSAASAARLRAAWAAPFSRPAFAGVTPVMRAVTLIEVLLVIVIVGVLAGMILPNFAGVSDKEQLEESARRIRAMLAMCRAQAMNNAVQYRAEIQQDGRFKLLRQVDPLVAPNEFRLVRESWADQEFPLPRVWVESVQELPDGPTPILLEDELEIVDELIVDPVPITDLESPLVLDFRPDGESTSAEWTLRHQDGRGLKMVLDGRVGRVTVEPVEPLNPDEVSMPERIPLTEAERASLTEPLETRRRPGGPWQRPALDGQGGGS